MPTSVERRLTTILSADAAGYSRLMDRDEAATLATLQAHRAIMTRLIADHGGRIVNTAGDSVLAEFASVVKAVECAIRVQRQIGERNATLPEDRRMQFRIGINLGDVMVDRGDLFGEGVNIAARLQALADPGGVLISGTVHEHVQNKLSVGFDYLGPQTVKNIPAPVPAYRVSLQAGRPRHAQPRAPQPQPGGPPQHARSLWQRLYWSAAVSGALVVLLLAINLLSWEGELWFQWPTLGIAFVFLLRLLAALRPDQGRR